MHGMFGPDLKGKTVEVIEGRFKGERGVVDKEVPYGWLVFGYVFPRHELRVIESTEGSGGE